MNPYPVVQRLLTRRIYLLILAHLLFAAASYNLAMQLRFDWAVPSDMWRLYGMTLPWIALVKLAGFHATGSLHGWWRYITFADLASLLLASTLSTLVIGALDYFFLWQFQIPRSVLLLDWGITVFLIGGLRSASRLFREHVVPSLAPDPRDPALMIGVTAADGSLAWGLPLGAVGEYRVVGFLADGGRHRGSRLGGIPFVGSSRDAVRLAQKLEIHCLLVVSNSLSGDRLRGLLNECREAGIEVKMLPSADELRRGNHRPHVRDIAINDLLRREPVQLDHQAIDAMLKGRRVMVTGAGGSIGSEICRQVLRCHPEQLLLVERAENVLFQIDRELAHVANTTAITPCVADMGDQPRMRAIFEQYRPELVFHAAAHKHVPMMEYNPGEAVTNNVFGTRTLAELADEFLVDRFVMISTDKAVRPTSVMGASKQLAERYVHALSERSDTRFVAVRFGNVLGSTGSVVPIFQEQIRRGGPVTITHADMQRYLMTIPEATELVLQAASMGRGGEIFVLDMGRPVKILDLARDMIQLSGVPPEQIEIVITGMRPGEKLYEELYLDEERTLPTAHPRLHAAYHRLCSLEEIRDAIERLVEVVHREPDAVRRALAEVVPEYLGPTRTDPAGTSSSLYSGDGESDGHGEPVGADSK